MGEGFSEADSGVEADAIWGDAEGVEGGEAFLEECLDLLGHVFVNWIVLHVFRVALHVHGYDAAVGCGADSLHFRVGGQAGDVVDDICACGEGCGGYGSLRGIDGYISVPLGAEGVDDGDGSVHFFIGSDWGGAGSGGFASDVDDSGTLGDHFPGMDEGFFDSFEFASVGEGIRGDVEGSHHLCVA